MCWCKLLGHVYEATYSCNFDQRKYQRGNVAQQLSRLPRWTRPKLTSIFRCGKRLYIHRLAGLPARRGGSSEEGVKTGERLFGHAEPFQASKPCSECKQHGLGQRGSAAVRGAAGQVEYGKRVGLVSLTTKSVMRPRIQCLLPLRGE